MADELDALLDETGIPPCPSYFHKAPEQIQPLLRRARDRAVNGERISPMALVTVIQREFGLTIDSRKIGHFLRHGCSCE